MRGRALATICKTAAICLVACTDTDDASIAAPSVSDNPSSASQTHGAAEVPSAANASSATSASTKGSSEPASTETKVATPIGVEGFTANGRIQPRGRPTTWWVEYGPTESYGSRTPSAELGPRRAAYYRESWDTTLGGFKGDIDGEGLKRVAQGGTSGGYVRFTAPGNDDPNHEDGIGFVQLTEYLHSGTCVGEGIANPFLGGGDTDMRDARIDIDVRGVDFRPNGTELVFWAQADLDLAAQNDEIWRRANWAFTGTTALTEAVTKGGWQHVSYQLANDSTQWSYAGTSIAQGRPNYVYGSIDQVLAHLNCNFFHMLVLTNLALPPAGAIDYDELTIAYRNHSVLLASNGGTLVSSPAGSSDPSTLTDGWRHGAGRTWQSAPNPTGPQELVYALARPVTVSAVQIHQDPANPSRDVEVLVSADGATWRSILTGALPSSSADGPNYLQLFANGLTESASFVKVRVLSGYGSARWGLGEVEVFGTGAKMGTDDDFYDVNVDVRGLVAGSTYHYRVVSSDGATTTAGLDRTFTVPATKNPQVATGVASRVSGTTVKLEGRLTAMGSPTESYFEWGSDTSYGDTTNPTYAGAEQTPRLVVGSIDYLEPGHTYHYRLVATNAQGTSYGADRSFTTPAK